MLAIPNKGNHTTRVLLWAASFTCGFITLVHPGCSLCHCHPISLLNNIPLYRHHVTSPFVSWCKSGLPTFSTLSVFLIEFIVVDMKWSLRILICIFLMASVTLLLLETNAVQDLLCTRLTKKIECSVYMSHSINLLNHVCQKPQKHCEGFVEKSHSLGACYVPQARLSVPRTPFSVGVTVPTVQGRNLGYGGDVTVPDPSHLDICWHFLDTDLNQSPPRHMKFTSKLLFLYFWVEFYRWKKNIKAGTNALIMHLVTLFVRTESWSCELLSGQRQVWV